MSPGDEPPPEEESDQKPTVADDPDALKTDPNPLNPAGDSLDKLIQMQFNDDVWKTMLGELPCLEATEACIRQLQGRAIASSKTLKAIDERVTVINQKIDEAKKNNQKTIALSVFEPLVQSYLKVEDVPVQQGQEPRKRGFLDRVFDFFVKPTGTINEILSLVGVPLFRNLTGGDAAAQQRSIAIADLQVKVAEVEKQRDELKDKLREQVILQVLDFDTIRRDFQVSQEIAKREVLRMKVIEVGYRFGDGNTVSYLGNLSAMDKQKAETFRQWARLRSQLARVKLLVLGTDNE
ncbi:hypothetical protein K9N68_06000 [Kovacikia minuta CCNUW1]|uniref:hypothetical protein n=1 Tax=Kovacikia minuta TaxID=2931930 RepID=UPI001CC930FE|nr:hypothetical protein [Kovacikia minuta]UBF27493.1 hypothetical protein K9N68_06000 [Kovacikia minuta CCNUW1]